MRYVWLVLAVFFSRFLTTAIAFPQVDGDIGWQRWLGSKILTDGQIPRNLGLETFSSVGSPWTPQEWLFSIMAWKSGSGPFWWLFAGAIALAPVIAILISVQRSRLRGSSERVNLIISAFMGIAMFQSFGVRAQILGWLFLAIFVYLLEIDNKRSYFALAVVILWSNFHASVIIAPILSGILLLGSFLDDRGFSERCKRLSIITIGSFFAFCVNPFGINLPLYAISLLSSPIKQYILEWRRVSIDDFSFMVGALPLLLIAIIFGARRSTWRDRLLLLAAIGLCITAARNVVVAAILVSPIAAGALTLSHSLFSVKPRNPETSIDKKAIWVLPVIAFTMAIFLSIGLLHQPADPEEDLAYEPLSALQSIPGEHRLLCGDFGWCGNMVGKKNIRVFLDGRADPYPISVWNTYVDIVKTKVGWQKEVDQNQINTIVVRKKSRLSKALAKEKGWKNAYSDSRFSLWTKG